MSEFLENIEREGADPFAALEKETPSESLPEKEPKVPNEVEEPVAGENTQKENVPFHKDPRWIKRENELKELREKDEATAKELAELRTITQETARRFEPQGSIPEWFQELYGANEVAWRKFQEHDSAQREELKQQILQEQQQVQQAQAQEAQKWNKWVDEEIDKLKEEGHTFDRNKLIKTMLEYRPTDENNNFDFKKGIAIYEAMEKKEDPAKIEARKQLADTTTRSSGDGQKKKDYQTPGTLRNRSWASL